MRDRITTGNQNFDDLMGGGIPQINQVLIAGTAGAGKSLLSMQILYKNAKNGKRGILISLEELREQLIQEATLAFSEFTDLQVMIDRGAIQVYDIEMFRKELGKSIKRSSKESINMAASSRKELLSAFCNQVETLLEKLLASSKADIVIIDNITILRDIFDDPVEFRHFVIELGILLKRYGVTGIYIAERTAANPAEQEFFTFDGVITMYTQDGGGKKLPVLEINKMRRTDHSYATSPYKVTSSGIKLLSGEKGTF